MIIDALFVTRLLPLVLASFIATRNRDFTGVTICLLYICVTTVNYLFHDSALNAIFSTPLVFITAWYIIQSDSRNKRNKIKLVKE